MTTKHKDAAIVVACVCGVSLLFYGAYRSHRQSVVQEEYKENLVIMTGTASKLSRNVPEGVKDGDITVTERVDYWGRPMMAEFAIRPNCVKVTVRSCGHDAGDPADDVSATIQMSRIGNQ